MRPEPCEKCFRAGQRLGYKNVFRADLSFQVDDDHIALNQAGMHVIDLVPFFGNSAPQGVSDYTYWHTLQDTVDKCDPASLKIVGETVAEVFTAKRPLPELVKPLAAPKRVDNRGILHKLRRDLQLQALNLPAIAKS